MRKTTCLILALTLTLLCGCGSRSNEDDAQDSRNTQQEEFVITPMASGLELAPYSCADFSMSVPEGWMVEAATSNAGMYHALRAYDPVCSVNQILYILKAEPLFADDFLKQNYTYWNAAYAAFPYGRGVREGLLRRAAAVSVGGCRRAVLQQPPLPAV